MDAIVLDDIPFRLELDDLLERLHVDKGSADVEQVEQLAREAEAAGKPRGLYKIAYVDSKGDDFVVVDGVKLTSRVLRVNLGDVHRVFPHVATCGPELEEWSAAIRDPLVGYWADSIKRVALGQASKAVSEHLAERFRPGELSSMAPGSLEDWPIEQQRPLFDILGDTEGLIGVRLTDSFLMRPIKSLSGIRFPTEVSFESCQLCPREKCSGRRAAYDPHLYETKYAR